MKHIIFWITAVVIVVQINWMIVEKERTLAHGRSIFLRLVPVDPRSLMQGDYMRLRYAIADEIPVSSLKREGTIVVSTDVNNIGTFVRIHGDEPLQTGECLLYYRNRNGLRIGAESFFFQEGTADQYANARYAELKVDATGKSILVGLRGEFQNDETTSN